MKEKMSVDGVTHAVKVFLFAMPPTIVAHLDRSDNYRWAFGASLIAGALLQSIIPPHRVGLKPLLITCVAFAIVWMFVGAVNQTIELPIDLMSINRLSTGANNGSMTIA